MQSDSKNMHVHKEWATKRCCHFETAALCYGREIYSQNCENTDDSEQISAFHKHICQKKKKSQSVC